MSSWTWPRRRTVLITLAALFATGVITLLGAAAYYFIVVAPNVPDIDAVTDYKPKVPLRIYTADNVLIGEFGEEHRDFIPVSKMPDMIKKAVLAIEDKRFYAHGGIDWIRALGAARSNMGGRFREGASTITMQVARNFFLSREKLVSRKLNEIALAYKIERALNKDQILELYLNHIYLGQRAYGFGSAARTYFGKPLERLSLAETAMLAGLPQNPARNNPAVNPKKAKQRQMSVLRSLRSQGQISEAQYRQALAEPLRVNTKGLEFETRAEYVAELARQAVYAQYKEEAYTRGIVVVTTIRKADQDAAYESLRRNVLDYDLRHGYRGPEGFIDLPAADDEREEAIDEALGKRPRVDRLVPVVVRYATPKLVSVETAGGDIIEIKGDGLRLATAALRANAKPALKLVPGAVIRITQNAKKAWAISQVPQVSAAFVALDANTGAYRALVGGFDFNMRPFNAVTQAWRQPGSAIKPFVYSAALEKGFGPGTLILDEALDLPGENAGNTWSPQNDDFKFEGPITMRHALAHSKNVVSVRVLRAASIPFTHQFLGHFGFDAARHPQNLTMALGTGAVTPQQMAVAYAVFANGGYRVQPHLIASIRDGNGKLLAQATPPVAGQGGERVIDERNAFLVDSMLRDVARYGTGAAATQKLGRADIAGKTGTTSDAIDGWFAGYGGDVVGVAWMGYAEPRSLGGREFGATLAMPIWVDYMRVALAKRPEQERPVPEGLTRDGDDWNYTEYLGQPEVRAIDVDPWDLPRAPGDPDGAPMDEPMDAPAPDPLPPLPQVPSAGPTEVRIELPHAN
ncbi:PBP1A family penicillin-binding protein [Massilia glaciei]|uniref:Penicillin-binding protein 1A n=1 Tax=Massilia glaciei TaxID=1524097 RepID=A0A2U2HIJ3_9BURK|nr:PBP1A family penicillin-binding protein [Massilia glaciei]